VVQPALEYRSLPQSPEKRLSGGGGAIADRGPVAALLAIKLVVAWRVMALVKAGREQPDRALSEWLTEGECCALQAVVAARPSLRPAKVKSRGPTVRDGVQWLAQLGGHLGEGGRPGWSVAGRARIRTSTDILLGWQLAHGATKCA